METAAKDLTSNEGAAKEAGAKDVAASESAVNQAGAKVTVSDEAVTKEKATTQSRVDPLTLIDDSYWPARALRSLRENRFSEAISLCDAGLQDDDPAPISGFLIKAQALASLGRLKDSLSTLTDALRVDPENQMAFKLLGDIHFAEGEEEAAMSYYRRIHSQRLQEETIGIALEIGTPLSAALKKVFMSRTTSDTIELSSQAGASQTGEPKIAPSSTPVERRPFQVEEQKAPEDAVDKSEEPTPRGGPPESESPAQVTDPVGRNRLLVPPIEKTRTQEPEVSAGSMTTDKEPTPRGGAPVSEKPTQSVTIKRKAETASSTPSKTSSKPTKDTSQTASRITLPESFQTETMADIFMRQGLHFEAAEILRKLHTRNPSDSLKTKLEEAESGKVGK